MRTAERPVTVTRESVRVGGTTRTLTVVSPQDGTRPLPVVLLFHGSNQSAEKLRAFSGRTFDRMASQRGAVVAYLDGHKSNWNDARVSNTFAARRDGMDDVAFAFAVVGLLSERYGGDATRVHAIGFSMGGHMVIRLAHEAPERLSGIALLSSTQPVPDNFAPSESRSRPLPTVIFHGTKDRLVPYDGGMASLWGLRPRGLGMSAQDTAAYYAARNQITAPPVTHRVTEPDRRGIWAERTDYRQDGAPPVALFTVHGGGHTVPGPKRAPRIMGPTATAPVAADVIADFLPLTAAH